MTTVKRIQFTATINAPVGVVWHHVTSPASYRNWASAFTEGCYFEGSWEQGAKIRFLSPGGGGMVSEIVENRKNAFNSIRHVGFIASGAEDTTSEAILAWVPAYENYTFQARPDGTSMVVDLDVTADFEEDMNQAWPNALALLKNLSESSPAA